MERRKRSIETPQRIVSMISNLYPLFLAHFPVDDEKSWFDFDARRFGASSSSFVNTCTGKRGGRSTVRDCTRSQITDIRPINDVLPSMPSIIRLRAISRVIACTMNRSLLKKKGEREGEKRKNHPANCVTTRLRNRRGRKYFFFRGGISSRLNSIRSVSLRLLII